MSAATVAQITEENARRIAVDAFEAGRYYEQGVTLANLPRVKPETRGRRVLERGFALLDEDRVHGAANAQALLQGYTEATNGVA